MIGFGFHWLKNWRESFKPITKRSNRNHVITFDRHLKSALTHLNLVFVLGLFWGKALVELEGHLTFIVCISRTIGVIL